MLSTPTILHPSIPRAVATPAENYSRAYLRHLFMAKEILSSRLNTIHNLAYYQNLMKELRQAINSDGVEQFSARFYDTMATTDNGSVSTRSDLFITGNEFVIPLGILKEVYFMIDVAYALGAPAGGEQQGGIAAFLPLIIIFAIFYFFIDPSATTKNEETSQFSRWLGEGKDGRYQRRDSWQDNRPH